MYFSLLGPTDVRNGGSRVAIAAGRQRVLLATLLLRANQVVSVAELAQALWDASPPASAQATLQNYVRRLRHALSDDRHDRIQTIQPGYLIAVRPAELDVTDFERLLRAGRDAARTGAWPQAAVLLGDALRLWRGRPLADLPPEGTIALEAQRLAGLELLAIETRVYADLRLGRHPALIPELRQLTARHPLRERLHGLLMLALWLDGQHAAAIMAYRQARGIVRGELGIEPGVELRDLNEQMTRGRRGPAPAPPAEAMDLVQTMRELALGSAGLLRLG